MSIVENRKFVVFALTVFASFAVYAIYLQVLPDPRFESGPIGPDRMYLWELIHWAVSSVVVLGLLFAVLVHAYKHKKYKWLALIIFVWPSMFYYAWRHSESS